jgi:hypothetical protein
MIKALERFMSQKKKIHPMNCKSNNVSKKCETRGLIKLNKTWSERTRNMRELTT